MLLFLSLVGLLVLGAMSKHFFISFYFISFIKLTGSYIRAPSINIMYFKQFHSDSISTTMA